MHFLWLPCVRSREEMARDNYRIWRFSPIFSGIDAYPERHRTGLGFGG